MESSEIKFTLQILEPKEGDNVEELNTKFSEIYGKALSKMRDQMLKDLITDYTANNTIFIGGNWISTLIGNRLKSAPHGSLLYTKDKLVMDPKSLEDTDYFALNLVHEMIQCKESNKPFRLEILRQELKVAIPEILVSYHTDKEPLKEWFKEYLSQDPPVYFYTRTKLSQVRRLLGRFLRPTMIETIAFCHWTETVPILTALSASELGLRGPKLRYFYRDIIRDYIISYLKVGDET
jgi:hypothetical protein